MFLNELPEQGVERVYVEPARTPYDQAYGRRQSEPPRGQPAWIDADALASAVRSKISSVDHDEDTGGYSMGMLVRHEQYGLGKITEVRGSGILRRVRVRFSAAGERTFVADKVKLAILPTP